MKDFLKFHNIEPLNEKLVQQHSSKAFLKKKKKGCVQRQNPPYDSVFLGAHKQKERQQQRKTHIRIFFRIKTTLWWGRGNRYLDAKRNAKKF